MQLVSEGLAHGAVTAGDYGTHVFVTFIAAPVEASSRITGSLASLLEGTRVVRHCGKPLRFITLGLEAFQQGVEFFDPILMDIPPTRDRIRFDENGFFRPAPGKQRRQVQLLMETDDDGDHAQASGIIPLPAMPSAGTPRKNNQSDGTLTVKMSLMQSSAVMSTTESQVQHNASSAALLASPSPRANFTSVGFMDAFKKEEHKKEVVINVFDNNFEGLTENAIRLNRSDQFQVNHAAHCCLILIPFFNIFWLPIWVFHCFGVLEWF